MVWQLTRLEEFEVDVACLSSLEMCLRYNSGQVEFDHSLLRDYSRI